MKSIKRPALIDVHSHFLNLSFIPEEVFESMAPIKKSLTGSKLFQLSLGLSKYFKTFPKPRIEEYFRLINSPINKIVRNQDNNLTDIKIALLLDLNMACLSFKGIANQLIPYNAQIQIFSDLMKNNPWKIFSFVMFDPRRPNADELCIKAIRELGFIGIKMYPAIGYNPAPEKNNSKDFSKRLINIYTYCERNNIPITTHASMKGLHFNKESEVKSWEYTDIKNWERVLGQFALKVNFAHFGGNYLNFPEIKKRKKAREWRIKILKLMKKYNQKTEGPKIFADLSYHYMAMGQTSNRETKLTDLKTKSSYFKDLNRLLSSEDYYKNYILFGTDSPMINHTWSEEEYIQTFIDNLDGEKQKKIFNTNPISFLFSSNKIPEYYIKFLKSHNKEATCINSLPEWIVSENENEYYLA